LDNREGIQPESMKPLPGHTPGKPDESANGVPPSTPQGLVPATAKTAPSQTDVSEEPAGFFNAWNLSILVLGVCLFFLVLWKFTFIEIWAIIKAVLGLSFVIFIHELGHFLAAKWCDVNVSAFSIGFGPAVPGCWFTWGETTYKIGILPLGGYVQMVGQVDGDESADDGDDPRSYRKKTVPQRMLIISAGVVMNAILAMCCFVAVYQGPGKEYPSAVINYVDTSAPAFKHGLRSGGIITDIDGVKNPNFSDFTQMVINSLKGRPLEVTYKTYSQKAGEQVFTIAIEPGMDENNKKPVFGVSPPPKLQFPARRGTQEGPYYAGTPAARPIAGNFEYGDVIIAMTDPDDPKHTITEIDIDPRNPNKSQRDYFEFQRRLELLADKEITIRVRRKIEQTGKEVKPHPEIKVAPMYRLKLGVVMQMGPVQAVREGTDAYKEVFPPRTKDDKKLKGDVIERVCFLDENDKEELVWNDKPQGNEKQLDPERLPFELRQWSDQLDRKGRMGKRKVKLHLARHSDQPGQELVPNGVDKVLEWDTSWRFDRAGPISLNAPMSIPELGLAYEIKSTVIAVTDPKSNFKKDDVIKNYRFDMEAYEEEVPWLPQTVYQIAPFLRPESEAGKIRWLDTELKEGQWAHVSFMVFQKPYKFKKLLFKVERDKKIEEIEIPIVEDPTWPLVDRGWVLTSDTRRVTANDPLHAFWLGMVDTKNIVLNLRGMILGRIGLTNVGGPLTIAVVTYRVAGMDFADLLFLLGLISINLAIVNFLPIPVLDGGHMVFLIYEGIRKKPASETVRIVATYAGLAFILLLMISLLWLDVIRNFFSS
jgi:regulator of sigma E protease